MTRRKFLWLGTAAVAMARCPALAASGDLRVIARDAFIYVLPLIEMAATRGRAIAAGGAQNTLYSRRTLADHTSRGVTSPNNDTLYSSAWLDLTAGPVTFTLPNFGKRYFSLQLMDMYTNNFAVLGTRTIGNGSGAFTIIGPTDAVELSRRNVVRSPTPHVWALARVLVDGPDDLEAARIAQVGITFAGPKVDAQKR